MSSANSPNFPSLHLRHNSFSNPSVALLTSQLILQPFRCFTYVIAHSPTFLSLLLRHRLFTYVTWRTAHAVDRDVPFSIACLYMPIIFRSAIFQSNKIYAITTPYKHTVADKRLLPDSNAGALVINIAHYLNLISVFLAEFGYCSFQAATYFPHKL